MLIMIQICSSQTKLTKLQKIKVSKAFVKLADACPPVLRRCLKVPTTRGEQKKTKSTDKKIKF